MTSPAYRDDQITVHLGDCLDILPTLADNSVDAIVTDPPYEISFMSRSWDASGIAYNVDVWRHCLRVLKPGAHLVAFGGTRTWHRLAVAIEDAGFEIRDSIVWLYGSGFPKSLDVSKAIDKAAGIEREVVGSQRITGCSPDRAEFGANDRSGGKGMGFRPGHIDITAPATDNAKQWAGWGTALKPAHEPIILARKPLQGTVAANLLAHGTGALNIDACRIEGGARPHIVGDYKQTDNAVWSGRMDGSLQGGSKYAGETMQGRWPANVVLDEQAAAELDKQSGFRRPGERAAAKGIKSAPGANGTMGGGWSGSAQETREVLDAGGGASRFFYTPKASPDERPTHNGTTHPTIKPVSLISWLIRLCCPPHGTVLDPFAGTGSTAEAALLEHKSCILIEREPDYLPLITARLSKPIQIGFDWETA